MRPFSDKQIAREKKKLKSTTLDKSLNSDKVSNAAAIFGGNSASRMVAVAASRVNLLESERDLLERLKFPRTAEDQALIEKELVNLRTTRRNLDDAATQLRAVATFFDHLADGHERLPVAPAAANQDHIALLA